MALHLQNKIPFPSETYKVSDNIQAKDKKNLRGTDKISSCYKGQFINPLLINLNSHLSVQLSYTFTGLWSLNYGAALHCTKQSSAL